MFDAGTSIGVGETLVDIFINYRTADAAHGAAACYELLAAQFGADRVFRDCISMTPGQDYPSAINTALEQVQVLVAIIGPRWLATDASGNQLIDNPRDWVRREIARALDREILVIPLLLDEASLPSADDLPPDVAGLTRRQVARVRHQLLGPDVRRLADNIAQHVPRLGAHTPAVIPQRRFALLDWIRPRRRIDKIPAAPVWSGSVVQRPELHAEIVHLLTGQERSTPIGLTTAMRGAGGFGKTMLAAEVCRDPVIVDRFPGGIFWVTLGERPKKSELTQMINDLCRQLRDTHEDSPPLNDLHQAGQELGRLLGRRGRALLVVDDVWSAQDLRPFLYGGQGCVRLITTRMAAALPDGSPHIKVDELTVAQARALLTRGVDGLSRHVVDDLVRLTGRWALLVALVNRALMEAIDDGAEPDTAAVGIGVTLRRDGPAALDLGDAQQREHLVGATIDLSLSFLSAADRERFLKLGLFPEDVWIPEYLLAVVWGETDATRLCRQMARMSLVAGRRAGDGAAIRLHDVVRGYLRGRRDLAADHRWLLDNVAPLVGSPDAERNPRWWDLPLDAEYLWRWLPHHLEEAGRRAEHAALVTDLRWLTKKTRVSGPLNAEADIAGVDAPLAASLRFSVAQSAHLLGPTDPADAVESVLLSRLHADPVLRPHVEAFAANTPRLSNLWDLPDLPNPALVRVITGHDEPIRACTWSPDNTLLATVGQDRIVRLFNVAQCAQEHELPGHTGAVNACAWSPDGTLIATASDDGDVRVWRVGDGTESTSFTGRGSAMTGCAWSPCGTLLASSGQDGVVQIWAVATGLLRHEFGSDTGPVNACAWSPDGTLIATACEDGVVRLWQVAHGRLALELVGHNGWVRACAWSPDAERLASCGQDGVVRIWDVRSGVQNAALHGEAGWVTDCAWSPDGVLVAAAGDDGLVRVWSVADAAQHSVLSGHTGWVGACSWSSDGTLLASAGHDSSVRLWNVAHRAEPIHPADHVGTVYGLSWSPNGKRLATAGDDHTVRLWDASGAVRQQVSEHTGPVRACAWSPDGTRLASASDDGFVRVGHPGRLEAWTELGRQTGWVYGCAWSPDGKRIASTGDQSLTLWNVGTGAQEAVLAGHTGWVHNCAWAPDGTLIASAGDQTVRIWDAASGRQMMVLSGHTGWVTSCAWSPDGAVVASASADRTARVWDATDGSLLAELTGHTDAVRACDWSPDGELLATAGDRTARVWDWRTGRCVTLMRTEKELLACGWSPDGTTLALAGRGGVYVFAYHP
ncbi:NB-ARC domain-containing protein [Lentzea sp. NPDC058436]|uniref:WD40 domain-containing protein n=1 Tax=Lentzea sp. NPDC058436 TaxID=3346499 RepID=UPI00364E53B6